MENSGQLIEDLARALSCAYLSDLYSPALRPRLLSAISAINPEEYPCGQWNDAGSYLMQRPCGCVDEATARGLILEELKKEE